MSKKKMVYAALAVVAIALACFGWRLTSRGAYETADYTVLHSDGPFEIREYPTLIMATTSSEFASQGEDGSFMRLFRYISGDNDDERKVAMTTPVFMQKEPNASQMGFVIPKRDVELGVPEPADDSVAIEQRRGGKYAVLRFRGRVDDKLLADADEELRSWMRDSGREGDPQTEFAGYDPPWTPGPLRRNEVLIRLHYP